ncbi:Pycsar system effector family protein [Actinospica robiniae]|uniref:Pycsar system effector family protein n=1 Tax=Actinospica robiniae TaxID=304901 RepID=UPI0004290C1D|nr:Pycsar system effector family protein [Actinospica robiniae]
MSRAQKARATGEQAPVRQQPSVVAHLAAQAEHAIERADGKASALAATATAILIFAAQGLGTAHPGAAGLTLLIGAGVCWVAGIAALGAAIFPRFAGSPEDAVWLHQFPGKHDSATLSSVLSTANADPERWLRAQAEVLGRIAMTKFRYVRIGMALLGFGAAFAVVGLLLG